MRLSRLPAAALIAFGLLFSARAEPAAEVSKFLAAARAQIGRTVQYDPAYVTLDYPGGDVPLDRGVCSDVAVRAFRALGIDLQKELHEDMKQAWSAYPKQWGLSRPDSNIDHRRVLNLITFFKRRGKALPVTQDAADYRPGDLVTCLVPPHLPHIMIVSDAFSADDPQRRLIIHNIGQGARAEDRLFEFQLTGHFRYW